MVRYYGLYANAHRGKIKKASLAAFPLRIIEDKLRRIPSKGWAEMIRKVYEVDPMVCPKCGGTMKVIAFRYFELNLTSPRAAIYIHSRWLEGKIGA
jgi:hypothetical protein